MHSVIPQHQNNSRAGARVQEEVRCDARRVLAAHPGLLLYSLAYHTGPRTAFLRDACGSRLPPPAEYLTLSDAAFCAGPGACQVPRCALDSVHCSWFLCL